MGLLGELTYALIRGGTSSIGNLIPDITIEEQHRDEVAITRHPVEGGAVITDHAYALPSELEIKCGYSNSTAGAEGYIQQQYAEFRKLQLARKPFAVYTDKRKYDNMLIRGLSTGTDEKTKNVFIANVTLQQVLIVSTQTTSGTGTNTTTASGDNANQTDPASTSNVVNGGNVATDGVQSSAFAGAYNASTLNPGTYDVNGNLNQNPSFGLNGGPGFGAGFTAEPVDSGVAGGVLNPTPTITGGVPEVALLPTSPIDGIATPNQIAVTIPTAPQIGGLQGAGPDQYNIFGTGP